MAEEERNGGSNALGVTADIDLHEVQRTQVGGGTAPINGPKGRRGPA